MSNLHLVTMTCNSTPIVYPKKIYILWGTERWSSNREFLTFFYDEQKANDDVKNWLGPNSAFIRVEVEPALASG